MPARPRPVPWLAALLVAVAVVGVAGACTGEVRPRPPGATTTSVASSTSPTTDVQDPALNLCLMAEPVVPAPVVAEGALTEISGVAASRSHDGVLWVQVDSGGPPSVAAVGLDDGAALGTWTLDGATNVDWEDIALGPGPAPGDWLYLADIGDNLRARPEVVVYRVPEPDPAGGSGSLGGVEALTFTYPDGAHDAEALLVDPVTGDLVIVTKVLLGPSGIYRAPGGVAAGSTTVLEAAGTVDLRPVGTAATGADIGTAGSLVAIRTYTGLGLWWRQSGQTVAEALTTGSPCPAPTAGEGQGEAVAVLGEWGGYVTISEGVNPPVNRFTR